MKLGTGYLSWPASNRLRPSSASVLPRLFLFHHQLIASGECKGWVELHESSSRGLTSSFAEGQRSFLQHIKRDIAPFNAQHPTNVTGHKFTFLAVPPKPFLLTVTKQPWVRCTSSVNALAVVVAIRVVPAFVCGRKRNEKPFNA